LGKPEASPGPTGGGVTQLLRTDVTATGDAHQLGSRSRSTCPSVHVVDDSVVAGRTAGSSDHLVPDVRRVDVEDQPRVPEPPAMTTFLRRM